MATIFQVTAALLLLPTGLLNYAHGSFSSRDDKVVVFPEFDLESFRGQFEQIRGQTLKHKYVPPASAGTAATMERPGVDQARLDIPIVNVTPLSEKVQGSALNTNSRNLQEGGCSDVATPIFVSSTVFPLMEGCLSPFLIDGLSGYASATGRIVRAPAVDSSDPPSWVAEYLNSAGGRTLACLSEGNADLVDPSETAWFCDTAVDGSELLPADDEMSVSCGCSITSPSSMVTAAAASSTTVPACGGGDSFSIVSETLPDTEGCYLDTGSVSNAKVIYTTSGTDDFGQMWMVALDLSGDAISTAGNIHWFLVNVAASGEDEDSDFFCSSEVEAAFYHPSEVPSWACVEGVSIDMACGCSSSTSTVTSSTSPRTPTPIAQPMAQPTAAPASIPASSPVTANEPELNTNTCPEDGSFTITSNADPDLDGCFTATTAPGGEPGYTVSGTTTVSEVAVFSLEFDDGDFKWIIAFLDPGAVFVRQFCGSVESASEVNPANASWNCDFTGDGENFSLTSNEDISIVCGSCDASVTGGATSDAGPASKSGVGVVAVGGAGMVAVASSFAGWC